MSARGQALLLLPKGRWRGWASADADGGETAPRTERGRGGTVRSAALAQTVTPLRRRPAQRGADASPGVASTSAGSSGQGALKGRAPAAPPAEPAALRPQPAQASTPRGAQARPRAAIDPDFTLDLHGHTLDQAHVRLDHGLLQAKAMGARLVLLITGKPRPARPPTAARKRGAIRAKVLDWLAAGPHASDIAAMRNAHRRHGGEGALYLVLKRPR